MNSRLLETVLRNHQQSFITEVEIEGVMGGTSNSRYSKVKRLLSQGKLLHIRRGLYGITENPIKPHPYSLAQLIYGPSYISFESALSFHKLIPETSHTITSATGKRSKEFNTPLGVFSYQHLPAENLLIGVEIIEESGQRFCMAKPWKAIADWVYFYKKNWRNLESLKESLRIDFEDLPVFSDQEAEFLEDYYQDNRLSRFLKGVRKDFLSTRS